MGADAFSPGGPADGIHGVGGDRTASAVCCAGLFIFLFRGLLLPLVRRAGLIPALFLFGLPALLWAPALFVLGAQGMLGAYGLLRR